MAPQARTLSDRDPESLQVVEGTPTVCIETDSSQASTADNDSRIIVQKGDIPPHPDDIIHKFWYETLVRLRLTLFVFLGLALMLALSLGVAMQMFFSVMVMQELNARAVLGIVLVPVILLLSAVLVDEMIDVGLDAMDLPSFGLFRASVTASMRSCFPAWSTRKTEFGLLVILELFPLLIGLSCCLQRPQQRHDSWYTQLLMGYILGGVLSAYMISVAYVISHIRVAHCPLTEARMNVLWHNMGNLGELKDVRHDVVEAADADDSSVRWKRCVLFISAAAGVELLVLLIFLFWKSFPFMFSGLMLTTIFMALAFTSYAPRLLGKAFWLTLIFFVVLTVSLTFGTATRMPEAKEFVPTALAPGASGYGASLENHGLPLTFRPPFGAPSPGYPVCKVRWGSNASDSQEQQLDIFDVAMLTKASYAPQRLTEWALGAMLNGTSLQEFEVLENQPDSSIGRSVVIEFPKQKLRVMAVRGTTVMEDAYADLQIYCAIAIMQFFGHMVPVLKAMPTHMVQGVLKSSPARAIFDSTDDAFLDSLKSQAEAHKAEAAKKGFGFMVTGHSLGGAIAGVISTKLGVDGIGISAPGLRYQLEKMGLSANRLQHSFVEIEPSNDMVPKIDDQRGMINWIKCDLDPLACHSLVKTTCELWSQCGDPRGRDYRTLCSQWYSQDAMNM